MPRGGAELGFSYNAGPLSNFVKGKRSVKASKNEANPLQ